MTKPRRVKALRIKAVLILDGKSAWVQFFEKRGKRRKRGANLCSRITDAGFIPCYCYSREGGSFFKFDIKPPHIRFK
jgi:lauroyl/myristoyl acyltransferase